MYKLLQQTVSTQHGHRMLRLRKQLEGLFPLPTVDGAAESADELVFDAVQPRVAEFSVLPLAPSAPEEEKDAVDITSGMAFLPAWNMACVMESLPMIVTLQCIRKDYRPISLHPMTVAYLCKRKVIKQLWRILVQWTSAATVYQSLETFGTRVPTLMCRRYNAESVARPPPPYTLASFGLVSNTWHTTDAWWAELPTGKALNHIMATYQLCVHLQRVLYPHLPSVPDDSANVRRKMRDRTTGELFLAMWWRPTSYKMTVYHLMANTPMNVGAKRICDTDDRRVQFCREVRREMTHQCSSWLHMREHVPSWVRTWRTRRAEEKLYTLSNCQQERQ